VEAEERGQLRLDVTPTPTAPELLAAMSAIGATRNSRVDSGALESVSVS
jgi:hypothetical protein